MAIRLDKWVPTEVQKEFKLSDGSSVFANIKCSPANYILSVWSKKARHVQREEFWTLRDAQARARRVVKQLEKEAGKYL